MDVTFAPLTSATLGLEPVVLVRVLGHGGRGRSGSGGPGPWFPLMSHHPLPRVMSEQSATSELSSCKTFWFLRLTEAASREYHPVLRNPGKNLGFGKGYLSVNSSDIGPLGCGSPRACFNRAPRLEEVETNSSQTVTTHMVRTIGGWGSLRGSGS